MASILITGAARGVGRALVADALARGHNVLATVRSAEDAKSLALLLGREGAILQFDVTNGKAVAKAAKKLNQKIDVLINNAGILGPNSQPALSSSIDDFAEILAVNTMAPLRVTQQFMPHLRQSSRARIINISSDLGSMANDDHQRVFYNASKVALNRVMQGLASELRLENIAVQLVHPGWVRTDMGGPEADISPEESAEGIMDRAEALTMAQTGTFVNYDGTTMPW